MRPPARAQAQARGAAWLAIAAVIVGFVLAPPTGRNTLPAGAAARLVDGQAERLDAGTWMAVAIGEVLPTGSQVRTPDDAARFEIGTGALELARGSLATLAEVIDLDSGGALVSVDAQRSVRVGFSEVRGRGTWRVDAGVSPRVGVYAGGVAVGVADADADGAVALSRYEQVELNDGAPSTPVSPLRYFFADPWDARLLADAIAVDGQVDRLTTAWSSLYGTDPRPASFYDGFGVGDGPLAANLDAFATTADGAGLGEPADVLVGIVVVGLLRDTAGLSPTRAVAEVIDLRRQSATWGLILARHDLGPEEIATAADAALSARAIDAGASASPAPTAPPAPTPSPVPSPVPSPQPSPSPRPSPSPTPRPSPSPSPSPSPGPLDDLLPALPGPGASPAEEVVDVLDGVLDEVVPVPVPGPGLP